MAIKYRNNIKNEIKKLPQVYDEKAHIWHIFAIRTKNREHLQKYLANNGIETLIHYPIPPHKQECLKENNKLHFPITEEIHNTILSIPISPVLTDNEVNYIIEKLNSYIL